MQATETTNINDNKQSEIPDKCKITLTKGTRKNEKCNRKVQEDGLCKMHLVLEQKKPDNSFTSHETTVSRNVNGKWTDGIHDFDDFQVNACIGAQ